MSERDRPQIEVEVFIHNEHRLPEGFNLPAVRRMAQPAAYAVLEIAKEGAALGRLEEVEVTLVSDAVIADVHVEFMAIDGATDVITFDHGEILISTETAGVQGVENGNPIERETALYLVHGLMHLAGYADKTEAEFAQMAGLQEEILLRVWDAAPD